MLTRRDRARLDDPNAQIDGNGLAEEIIGRALLRSGIQDRPEIFYAHLKNEI